MSARTSAAAGLARAAGSLSRLAGRGGGTTLPGHVFTRLAPAGIGEIAGGLADGVVAISATNGKTTTAAMLSHILAADRVVCRNASGANLLSGVASALVSCPADATVGVLEVDEAALPAVAAAARPRAVVLGNLFRDQLDRHGELEMVADRWRAMAAHLDPSTTLVVCADDPVLDGLCGDRPALRFGIDDATVALAEADEAADSTFCVRCGAPYAYSALYLGHLGAYRCPRGDHERGRLDLAARDIRPHGVDGISFRVDGPDASAEVRIALPGLYNVENALGAIAAAHVLGVPLAAAAERLATFSAAFGRFERVAVDGRDVVLVLFKNPTGANEALRAIQPDVADAHVLLALNDQIADGRDVSWIWDIDFEGRLDAARSITCSGRRAADMALRLRYAGIGIEDITRLVELEDGLNDAVRSAEPGGRVYVLATYTAMLELHRVLSTRGLTAPFWEGER